uniref:HMG box domain-containing protein n=1 Tax=Rhabditophanes sp. KR3021 TaxID=114890 RepID=A0AC35U3R6_9BILA
MPRQSKSNADGTAASRGVTKRVKKVKPEGQPKRAKSAYMIWLAEHRAELTKPGLNVCDVARLAGAAWNKLTDKVRWEELAAEDKKRYEREIAIYKAKPQS